MLGARERENEDMKGFICKKSSEDLHTDKVLYYS